MGPFIREIERAVETLKMTGRSDEMTQTVRSVINHLLRFQPVMRHGLIDEEWSCYTAHGSYGLLLVSRPPESRGRPEAYVDRVRDKIQRGVERIYVVGRDAEKEFVNYVAKQILSIRELKGLETFRLFHDYRGDSGGICISVGVDPVLKSLAPSLRISARLEPPPEAGTELNSESVQELDRNLAQLEEIVKQLIVGLSDYEGEWINLANLGGKLRELEPGFDPTKFGEKNLVSILRKFETLAFYERQDLQGKTIFVRSKNHESDSLSQDRDLLEMKGRVLKIIRESADGGAIYGSRIGAILGNAMPEFSSVRYGYRSLRAFISSIEELDVESADNGPNWYVNIKSSAAN